MRAIVSHVAFLVLLLTVHHVSFSDSALLVANTRGSNEITLISDDGTASIFYDGTGLSAPDNILLYEGYYYISTGTEIEDSSIARINAATGEVELTFASGGGLKRPYGFAFDQGLLYVASFMTDQILVYDASTGDFMEVFAQGNATEEGLVNGPNQIAIHDGTLYMTTQGSYIDGNGTLQYAFASQIVAFDLATGEGYVFAPQPEVMSSAGYVSMLGILIGCDDKSVVADDCTVYTTDFAGGLRLYALTTGDLVDYQSTNYVEGSITGSLSMSSTSTELYVTGSTTDDNGVIMVLDPSGMQNLTVIFGPDGGLSRPIGILYIEEDDDGAAGGDVGGEGGETPQAPPVDSEDEGETPTASPPSASPPSASPTIPLVMHWFLVALLYIGWH